MSHPALALQKAVRDALADSAVVAGEIAGRIYDLVPPGAVFPYVTIPEANIVDDANSCAAAWTAFATVHVWSRDDDLVGIKGMARAKRVAAAVIGALGTEIPIDGFQVTVGSFESARYMRDPDVLTSRGVLTFRYLIDPEP